MKVFLQIVVIFLNVSLYPGETIHDVQELYNTIFTNESYNKHLRGAVDQSKTLRILTNFSLLGIGNIVEMKEAFEVIGILEISWTDERLMWEPKKFNGTTTVIECFVYFLFPLLFVVRRERRIQLLIEKYSRYKFCIVDLTGC